MPAADDPSWTDSDGEVIRDSEAAAEPADEFIAARRRRRRLIRGWVQILLSLGLTVLIVILLLPQLSGEQ